MLGFVSRVFILRKIQNQNLKPTQDEGMGIYWIYNYALHMCIFLTFLNRRCDCHIFVIKNKFFEWLKIYEGFKNLSQ